MAKKKLKKKKEKIKHKPSTKRTLEDVLSSLQDLAKNELSDADLQSRTDVDADQPEKTKLNQDASEVKITSGDSIEMDILTPNAALESGQTGDIFSGLELLPEDQISATTDTEQTEGSVSEDAEAEIRWEDIPVLEDVADDPRDGGGTIPGMESVDCVGNRQSRTTQDAKAESPFDPDEFLVPDPKLARRIAIRVAARLNIEMHKQGSDGLDIATINRLRALLVKELTDAATKSENGDN